MVSVSRKSSRVPLVIAMAVVRSVGLSVVTLIVFVIFVCWQFYYLSVDYMVGNVTRVKVGPRSVVAVGVIFATSTACRFVTGSLPTISLHVVVGVRINSRVACFVS